MAASDFAIFRNRVMTAADANNRSPVSEPSLAASSSSIFYTGNWYAGKSLDNGRNWQFVSPFTELPSAAGGFCCDQLAIYEPSRDMIVWLLQYVKGANGENVFRIATNKQSDINSQGWSWHDFAPSSTDSDWTKLWFDYPDIALSNNYLWVSFNVFDASDDWVRAVVFKLPLDGLASGEALNYDYYSTTEYGSLRFAQGAGDTMYWVAHVLTASSALKQIRFFRWEEASDSIDAWTVATSSSERFPYSSMTPSNVNWLGRADARITGAWISNGVIGCMWTGAAGAHRPHAYIRVVRIDEQSKMVIDEPDIFSNDFAYAYPAATVNSRGHVGMTGFLGGGINHPSHVIGIRDDHNSGVWELQTVRSGTASPDRSVWGDYVSCRPAPDGFTWVASGFTAEDISGTMQIQPRFVHFGRRRDRPAVRRWSAPSV